MKHNLILNTNNINNITLNTSSRLTLISGTVITVLGPHCRARPPCRVRLLAQQPTRATARHRALRRARPTPAHTPVAAARSAARAAVHGGSGESSQLGARSRVAIGAAVARPDVVVGALVLVEALLFEQPLLIGGVAARLVAVGGVAHRRLAANVPEERVSEGDYPPRPKVGSAAGVLAAQPAVDQVVDGRVRQRVVGVGGVEQELCERRHVGGAEEDAVEAVREAQRRPVALVRGGLGDEVLQRRPAALAQEPVVLEEHQLLARQRHQLHQHVGHVDRLPPRALHLRRAAHRRLSGCGRLHLRGGRPHKEQTRAAPPLRTRHERVVDLLAVAIAAIARARIIHCDAHAPAREVGRWHLAPEWPKATRLATLGRCLTAAPASLRHISG
eukprot:scaffold53331_cov68-Phaeocystis_antarctica.AAC.7